jgi:hypothetical protein
MRAKELRMPIHRSQERLIQARFLLDLVRLLDPLPGVHGGHFEMTMIVVGVVFGELEGRPFQASKLAEFLRMPRPTLVRRLKDLVEDGIIERRGGRYFANPERINSPAFATRTAQVSALILAAADDIQRLREG